MTNAQIISAITDFAPLSYQESWDNSGVQVGCVDEECTGVMLCVDVTETVVDEAIDRGCSLIISHHPLLFRGLKSITGATAVERCVLKAIRHGLTIFSAHTCLDSARGGISHTMAKMLGATVERVLAPQADPEIGLGVVATLPHPMAATDFAALVRRTFNSPVCRTTTVPSDAISRIALCGGAGGEFIPAAITSGAQAYISSDTRYHDFVDHSNDIFLVDIGHFESENCAKSIFFDVIRKKFPNFAVYKSELEQNPINYL